MENVKRGSGDASAADLPLPTSGYQPEPFRGASGAPESNLRIIDNVRCPSGPEIVQNQVALAVGEIRIQKEPTLMGDVEAREMEENILATSCRNR